MNNGKIACIGFHKTGTTSLTRALSALGYTVKAAHGPVKKEVNFKAPDARDQIARVLISTLEQADAIQDSPTCFFYRELDEHFGKIKFIHTYREPDDWYASLFNHVKNVSPLRRWMYGVNHLRRRGKVIDTYNRLNEEISDYFRGRDDYLFMQLSKGDGWSELVGFLGPEWLPPFPHKNSRRLKAGQPPQRPA